VTAPRVSILIPTFNGAATLPETLDAIAAQRVDFAFETVAVDSGSRDATLERLRGRVGRLIEIPSETFDHGTTRNLGIELCGGELVVLMVQDAVPASDRWLAELVAPLDDDPGLAGSFARQVPRPGASALTRLNMGRWLGSTMQARVSAVAGREEFLGLPPVERHRLCIFDNVCACIRRAVWERHPFPSTAIAEDVAWAKQVLLAGHRLAYVPESVVIHSHERPVRYELWRTYLVHQRLRLLFELRTVPSGFHLLRAVALSLAVHGRCLLSAHGARVPPRELARALGLAVAWRV